MPVGVLLGKYCCLSRMTGNSWHVKEKRSYGLQERREKLRALLGKEREEFEVGQTFKLVCMCACIAFVVLTTSFRKR